MEMTADRSLTRHDLFDIMGQCNYLSYCNSSVVSAPAAASEICIIRSRIGLFRNTDYVYPASDGWTVACDSYIRGISHPGGSTANTRYQKEERNADYRIIREKCQRISQ